MNNNHKSPNKENDFVSEEVELDDYLLEAASGGMEVMKDPDNAADTSQKRQVSKKDITGESSPIFPSGTSTQKY